MLLLSRAVSYYRKNGLRQLVLSGVEFVLWGLIPESTGKQFIAKSKILTYCYFFLFGDSFYREMRSILYGQAYFVDDNNHSERSRVIRGIHRIEKGLSMRDRRSVFAEGYIVELVETLASVCETTKTVDGEGPLSDEQICWSFDVLNKYFSVVDRTSPIKTAYRTYTQLCSELEYEPGNQIPFPHHEIENQSVDPQALELLATQRTSVRWFRDEDVPRELIDESLRVALESPSACNRQSYEFRIFDDDALINKINKLPIGIQGYKENIPCLVVIVGKQRAYHNERDKHVIYIDASLAAMAFQFALETRNLGSCCINWPAIPSREAEMEDLLGLSEDETIIMLMAVGYPDPNGMIPYSSKKPLSNVRSYNQID